MTPPEPFNVPSALKRIARDETSELTALRVIDDNVFLDYRVDVDTNTKVTGLTELGPKLDKVVELLTRYGPKLDGILAALTESAGAAKANMLVNGSPATLVGVNRFMSDMLDNQVADLEVQWQDARGFNVDAEEGWVVGDDTPTATVVPDPTNTNKALLTPGSEKTDDGTAPRPIQVTVTGTNADGTTVPVVTVVSVGTSDAVGGAVSVSARNP